MILGNLHQFLKPLFSYLKTRFITITLHHLQHISWTPSVYWPLVYLWMDQWINWHRHLPPMTVGLQCPTLGDPTDCSPPGSSVHGISQARILGCHDLLQGIFLTQRLNLHLLCLLHWQAGSLPLEHLGSPRAGLTVGLFHSLHWNGFILLLKIYWLLFSWGLCLFF